MTSNGIWKDRLEGKLPEQLANEINTFEMEIELRSQDKIDEVQMAVVEATKSNRSKCFC